MGIYFSNIRSILEVKRKVNGQEEDLDNEENNEEPEQGSSEENNEQEDDNQDDEHADPDEANDYSMEVEDDDTDDTEDNSDTDGEDNETDTTEETPDEGDETSDDEGDSGEYTMDVEDDENSEEGSSDDTETDTTDDTTEETPDEGTDELKTLEDDIFKNVPPEQMNIKIMELKKQYLEVYATITDILTRTNKIPKTTLNMKVLEFIIDKLMELKDLVQFYLSNTFDTKTYVENMVNYQQYLATLNTINRLFKEIKTKKEK